MASHLRERLDLSSAATTRLTAVLLVGVLGSGSLLALLSARWRSGSSDPEFEAAVGAALAAPPIAADAISELLAQEGEHGELDAARWSRLTESPR